MLPGPFSVRRLMDGDVDDDVEANRRGVLAWRRARNVADCINAFSYFFFREAERFGGSRKGE